jgi:GNAT superfamily N-acetyltransferase
VRIRRAEDDDLIELARVFVRTATYLTERYRPEAVGHVSTDVEGRLPLYRHLRETGAVFVAEDDGLPVGFSAAVVRQGVWFLSQLWVLPEHHAGGIGSALLDEALAWGREGGARTFSVVASPHPAAQLMYLRASMYPLWTQLELTAGEARRPEAPPGVLPITEGDLGWVADLDRDVRGIVRPEDHAFWRGHATGLALRRDDRPAGYVYVWEDGKVGPGAAAEPRDVVSLIQAARHQAVGPVTFSVPSSNWTALHELVRLGFAPLGSNTFMASAPVADGTRYLSSGGALA